MLKLAEENERKPQAETTPLETIPKGYHYVNILPSKYRCYPQGTKIFSRPLKVLEIKHLATMNEETADMVIDEVLRDSVQGIDVNDLVVADKIFIIMWQRAQTYRGDEFSIPFTCPVCGHEGRYTFDITRVEIDDVVDDFSMDTEYDIGGRKVQLDQPRVKDLAETKKYTMEHPDADVEILTSIAYRIWKIDGNEVSLDEAYHFTVDMNPADFVKLNGICAKTEMKVKPTVMVKCEKCEKEVPARVSFRPDFFIPSYRGW